MGKTVYKSNAISVAALFIITGLAMMATTYVVSMSIASVFFVAFCVLIGLLFCFLLLEPTNRRQGSNVFLITFIYYIVITVLKYYDVINGFEAFSSEGNDHYMFWIESRVGENSASISKIFRSCIIDNDYIENGGYYLYIQSIAYYANRFFDGNNIMLQLLGTMLPGMLSSVVIYKLIGKYIGYEKAKKYALLYVLITPALTVCIGIHRDAWIAFLYLCLIYLWFAGNGIAKTIILGILIAALILPFRIQSGLFAFVFVFLTAFTRTEKNRWIFYVAIGLFLAIYGSLIFSIVNEELKGTIDVYEKLGSESLSAVNSGIGRYVYQLPSPIKEVAQLIVLQAQFPPWLNIENASSFWGVLLGFVQLIINFFWFLIFLYAFIMLFKRQSYKRVPKELLYGAGLFVVFILFNSSNLVLRRVVCIYPCLFVLYLYLRENLVSKYNSRLFNKRYSLVYGGLCLLYFGLKMFVG